ncbi:hypothetical protein KQH62_04320 [bacterium]|nr:hypothetical protein [bacterium]
MKKPLIAALLVLILSSLACSVSNIEMKTVDTRVVEIAEVLPSDMGPSELVFNMTGGSFDLTPGGDQFVNGTITYNVEQWEPRFTRSNNYYEIKQVNPLRISGIPTSEVVNKWELALTNSLPLDLTIEGGASENHFDFTGLQLTNLKITQGASETALRFDSPNPQVLDTFAFTTGASSAELYGLGYANFNQMNFSAGAGDYTLDFTGGLSHDATVNVKATISNITIMIPTGMRAVVINEGTVSNINTRGVWLLNDETYSTLDEGHTLTIHLDMAVGNVTLIQGGLE